MKKHDIYRLLLNIIIVVLAVIFIYQALMKIFGHSWQIESLVAVVVGSMIAIIISNRYSLGEIKGEFKYFKRSFGSLSSDFKDLRKDFYEFKTNQEKFNNWTRVKFNEIKNELSNINKKLSKA